MKRAVTALSLIALLATAGPAAAKPPKTLHLSGTTDSGNAISFSMKGKRMSKINTSVPTVCVPTKGRPRTRTTSFHPRGAFRLGRTRKTSTTERIDWWGDTTFNYTVSSKKVGRRKWKVKLHVNYSYVDYTLLGGGYVDQTGFVCQGDDTVTLLGVK